jgi:hypothetical protein
MQRSLHRRNAASCDIANFFERVAKNIHQDNAAAFRHRQAHECMQSGGGCLSLMNFVNWGGDHRYVLIAAQAPLP